MKVYLLKDHGYVLEISKNLSDFEGYKKSQIEVVEISKRWYKRLDNKLNGVYGHSRFFRKAFSLIAKGTDVYEAYKKALHEKKQEEAFERYYDL